MRARRLIRIVAPMLAASAVAVGCLGAGVADAAPTQAASGRRVATFITSEWWPRAKAEVGFPTPALKKVVCPKTVPATTTDPETTLSAALGDLAAGRIAPTVDSSTGVFTCVGRLDGQRLLIGGAIDEAGDARFATASLILSPDAMAESVAAEFATQVGGDADVVCSTRDLIVAQPDGPVRCTVTADDGTKGFAAVVLDGRAQVVSVDFTQK